MCDLLLALDGEGGSQVIHGNFDTYELMRAQQIASAREKEAALLKRQKDAERKSAPKGTSSSPDKGKKKRTFPFRKVEDIEAEIATAETALVAVETSLASPDLYRDGEKVKQTTQRFEELKVHIATLYEHWEEAIEMKT